MALPQTQSSSFISNQWQDIRTYALNMKVMGLGSKMVKGVTKIEVGLRLFTPVLDSCPELLAVHSLVIQSSCTLIKYFKHAVGLEKGLLHPHPPSSQRETVKKVLGIVYHTSAFVKDSFYILHSNYFIQLAYKQLGWGADYSPFSMELVNDIHEWCEIFIPVKETVRIIGLYSAVQAWKKTDNTKPKKLAQRRLVVIKSSLSVTSHSIRFGFWIGELVNKIYPLALPEMLITVLPYAVVLPTGLSVIACGLGLYNYYAFKVK